jgi:TonB family protein
MLKRIAVLSLAMLAAAASACAQDAEKTLKQFEGKVLVLRHPLHDNSQHYDAGGKELKGGREESWTTHGGMLIEHVELTPDKLRLSGRRMLFLFGPQLLAVTDLKKLKHHGKAPISPAMDVEIALRHPIDSEEQTREVLSKVFVLNTEDLLASVPDFWRQCLADHVTYDPMQPKDAEFSWRAPVVGRAKLTQNSALKPNDDRKDPESGEPVTHVGNGVSVPRPVFTPEPKFSEVAHYVGFQGVCVLKIIMGTDGHVHDVDVVRPLGFGLDESAVATVKTWRFQPAAREKQPVAVEMNVEVSFNLY